MFAELRQVAGQKAEIEPSMVASEIACDHEIELRIDIVDVPAPRRHEQTPAKQEGPPKCDTIVPRLRDRRHLTTAVSKHMACRWWRNDPRY